MKQFNAARRITDSGSGVSGKRSDGFHIVERSGRNDRRGVSRCIQGKSRLINERFGFLKRAKRVGLKKERHGCIAFPQSPAPTGVSMSIKSYEDLQVWTLAMDLVVECYRVTEGFPRDERFGITSQLRRAAVQIPANIAEGHARSHHREYLNFLSIAQGSAAELSTHIRIAQRIEFLGGPKQPNCQPVVNMCLREILGGATAHTFFWIHYPCHNSSDHYIGYSPVGYTVMHEIGEDRESVESGKAHCHRTDCSVECITRQGQRIGRDWKTSWGFGKGQYLPALGRKDCHDFVNSAVD